MPVGFAWQSFCLLRGLSEANVTLAKGCGVVTVSGLTGFCFEGAISLIEPTQKCIVAKAPQDAGAARITSIL